MTLRKLGVGVAVIGVLGLAFSFLADVLPGSRAGIQSAQILGIEASIVIFLIGIWISLANTDEKLAVGQRLRSWLDQVINLPVIAWALAGFLIAYLLFFVGPMFLNSDLRINYFYRYLPDKFPIGFDLATTIELAKGWLTANQSPYASEFYYPPFAYLFFAPLALVGDYPSVYRSFIVFSVFSYYILTFFLPVKILGQKHFPLVLLFFITGLTSYGLQFELERGQYNIFTFLLCLWSIYIFHYHPRYRIFAYLLFSVSVQLKLYPAIFIVMLIDNWRAWKSILLRFAGIVLFNILLLFIAGFRAFWDFLQSVSSQLVTPGLTWNGNHSIQAFVFNLTKDGYGIIGPDTLEIVRQNSNVIETCLFLAFVILFSVAILISYRRDRPGIDPYLLIACMIGALVIPISNDYTLSILAAPVALVLGSLPAPKSIPPKLVAIAMVLGIAFAYASTLIPFKYKPYYLNNAFPPLFLILIFATVLNLIRSRNSEATAEAT